MAAAATAAQAEIAPVSAVGNRAVAPVRPIVPDDSETAARLATPTVTAVSVPGRPRAVRIRAVNTAMFHGTSGSQPRSAAVIGATATSTSPATGRRKAATHPATASTSAA